MAGSAPGAAPIYGRQLTCARPRSMTPARLAAISSPVAERIHFRYTGAELARCDDTAAVCGLLFTALIPEAVKASSNTRKWGYNEPAR